MIKIIFKCEKCGNETGEIVNPAYFLGSTVHVCCNNCGAREPIERKVNPN